MVLRASAEAIGVQVDVRSITDPAIDSLIEGGDSLIGLVDAVLGREEMARTAAAEGIASMLGQEALVDAAGVIATFSMMNRIANATGMPVGRVSLQRGEEFRALTGIDRFRHD